MTKGGFKDKRLTFPVNKETHDKMESLKRISGIPLHKLVERALTYAYHNFDHWRDM